MAYGKIKADTLTWDNAGSDVDVTISTLPTAAALADKAPIDSPTFTGTPAAPTAAQGTNTTQLATTAYVQAEVGVSIQAYDANTAKTNVAQTFSAEQTFGEIKETVFTLGTTGSIALDPANGSIQLSVLTGNPTFTDSLDAGQSVVLHLENGASYTVTWPTMTWATAAGNAAPTLTAKDTLVFWKIATTLYGAYVGSYV